MVTSSHTRSYGRVGVAAKYRDRAPKFGIAPDGKEAWIIDDKFFMSVGVETGVGGRPYDEMVAKNARHRMLDGTHAPGMGDGRQRLREQDQDGIDAEILYPPVIGLGFIRNLLDKGDGDAYLAVLQGYNTWLGEDFCSVAPDRLIGMTMVPETGIDDAIAEMERCKKMGLHGVCLSKWPNGSDEASPDDDRFWAASLDLGMKMAPHQNFGGAPFVPPRLGAPADLSWIGSRSRITPRPARTIGLMIAKGVFDRFPDLKFYFAEADAGWIPYHLESTDDWYLRWHYEHNVNLPKLPSQYWRDHCRFSFLWDPAAIRERHAIGLDLLMWGTDLPHSTGSFPHSHEVLDAQFHGVPENERRQILVENVCRYFDLDPEKELTPTP